MPTDRRPPPSRPASGPAAGPTPGLASGPEVALEGTVERITFYNPTNGFSVVRLRVRGRREPIAVVGTLPAAQPGEILALRGRWQTDPRHGAQFRPTEAEVRRPSDVDGIVRYLGSGLVKQIGPVLAKRIVGTFGERTLDVLDATPERVREVPGIGPQRARGIATAWAEHRALRDVMAFLAEHALDTRFAPRLLATYGTDAVKILSANPYRLVADVPGLGFASADRLGMDRGVRHTAPVRVQGAIQAALIEAGQNGHTRLTRALLAEAAASLADVPLELVESGVVQLLAGGSIAVRRMDEGPLPPAPSPVRGEGGATDGGAINRAPTRTPDVGAQFITPTPDSPSASPSPAHRERGLGGEGTRPGRVRIYTPDDLPPAPTSSDDEPGLGIGLAGLVRVEEDLARRLLGLARRRGLPANRVERWLAADREARTLSDEQRQAVATAATSGCFVLTGGPGVGKTTTTRALVRCLQALGRTVSLAAPTGKAARRLGEVVGLEARTLHRLLGAGPRGFRHGPDDPLPCDTLIVDEASMLDTQLARAVVRAVGPGSQLILVGDADQLPSVGPGQVLRDVLASGRVPAARLETVFRQAARSQIVTNAHRIRQGLLPEMGTVTALSLPAERGGSDCVFVAAPAARVAAVAAEWAAVRLPRLLGVPSGEIQAIAPLVRVCQTLNGMLQERLNPARGQPERPHGALSLRAGDRVIQTHNNYLLGVFNGDTGTVVEIDGATGLKVDFGDGRVVQYGAVDLLDLDHAYGLTVHRAQGSEWPGVVVLASSSFGPILSRNLLYTAITRARRAVVVVGDEAAIREAVARTRDQERVTGLPVLLRAGEEPGARSQESGARSQEAGAEISRGAPDRGAMNRAPTRTDLVRAQFIAPPGAPPGAAPGAPPGTAPGAPPRDVTVVPRDAPSWMDDGAAMLDDGSEAIYDPMPDDWPD
ncbi:MAG: AAA family ATPase [Chloroflexota bacterium]